MILPTIILTASYMAFIGAGYLLGKYQSAGVVSRALYAIDLMDELENRYTALRHRVFQYERTVKEQRQRLLKFDYRNQPRDGRGHFIKRAKP